MGRYDDISADELRRQLLRFARLVRAMEKRDILLEKAPSLLRLLGELRQMIFAYEVRSTRGFAPGGPEAEESPSPGGPAGGGRDADPDLEASWRIVQEALEREEELQKELRRDLFEEDGDD